MSVKLMGRAGRLSSFLILGILFWNLNSRADAQAIVAKYSDQLSISDIGSAYFSPGRRTRSTATQMLLVDGPLAGQQYLYIASQQRGIQRAIYDNATQTLLENSLEPVASEVDGAVLGIAMHGGNLYATEMYQSSHSGNGSQSIDLSRIWRIADAGMGEATPIVSGIPRQDHGTNNIQIVGDSLYVGIGVRTRNGVIATWNGDTHGESAYGGSISVIPDLNAVGDGDNAAGFYPSDPTLTEYRQLIRGELPEAGMPFSTNDPGKLQVHSSGTRNPFGLAVDGDNQLWFTNNFHRVNNDDYDRDNLRGALADNDNFEGDGLQNDIHDQMFRAVPLADYGYRNGNWQDGNTRDNTEATDAGFFQPQNRTASYTFDNYIDTAANETDGDNPNYNQEYDSDNPSGLGPSSSANGFDFYRGHDFPLELHQDAFITRWQPGHDPDRAGDAAEFADVVAVNMANANVERIATGFNNPLDLVDDGQGNLIVADYGGSIFVISAVEGLATPHLFQWDSNVGGDWSDRLPWNADSVAEDDRIVPNSWGEARYEVTIDRPENAVRLDRNVRVEKLNLGARLALNGRNLTADVDVLAGGTLAGSGKVIGDVSNSGLVVANIEMMMTELTQNDTGTLSFGIRENDFDRLLVAGTATLGGDLLIRNRPSLDGGESVSVKLVEAASIVGSFDNLMVSGQNVDELGHASEGLFLSLATSQTDVTVDAYQALPGDANGDGIFNSNDLITVFSVGEYEDAIVGNSDWTDGDWSGDGDFDSTDMIVAFQTGGYSAAAVAVPEPASGLLGLAVALLFVVRLRR